jgi:predicted Zn-dependent protease
MMAEVNNQITDFGGREIGINSAILPVIFSTVPEPIIHHEESDEWKDVFTGLWHKIPKNNAIIIVTSVGLWHTDPMPRFLFAHSLNPGVAILSTKRFSPFNNATMIDRFGKAGIKSLGIALGIPTCQDPKCIMTYHYNLEDFDANIGVCEKCREIIQHILMGN